MHDILDVIKTVETVYSTNSSLATLKDFERVLDEMDLYVYKNWIEGELVEGPIVSRHWISAAFMWPREQMPDPMGAKRLLDYDCTVEYQKSTLIKPRKVLQVDDFRPGTKKGKMDEEPIWIVKITMPKKLVANIFNGYMSKMKDSYGIGQSDRVDQNPEVEAADQTGMMQQMAPGAQGMPTGGQPGVF